ncbi:hypothetical protein [Kytococcus aerolatus]|uniref:hypothetical protein n=1 Tax=Kytococcus aerolatus TaxID=592308 RepID=UPI00117A5D78|nr:hypothetical protein [Kytococcus aerolatus]
MSDVPVNHTPRTPGDSTGAGPSAGRQEVLPGTEAIDLARLQERVRQLEAEVEELEGRLHDVSSSARRPGTR